MDKNLEQFAMLEKVFFKSEVHFEYSWTFEKREYLLLWAEDVKSLFNFFAELEGSRSFEDEISEPNYGMYLYIEKGNSILKTCSDIYEALDEIKFKGKSLKQHLIEGKIIFDEIKYVPSRTNK